jgi:hypothetical protein
VERAKARQGCNIAGGKGWGGGGIGQLDARAAVLGEREMKCLDAGEKLSAVEWRTIAVRARLAR